MNSQHYPLNQLHLNPDNPRFIRDERYKQLVTSLADNPQLLEARPILCSDRTGKLIVLGGNMRLRAAKELKLTSVPVIVMTGLSYEQEREVIIKDNASFGSWDWDVLANEWSDLPLEEWGLDLPPAWSEEEPSEEDLLDDKEDKPATLRITFPTVEVLQKAEVDVQELLDRKYPGSYFVVSAGLL